MRFTHAGTDYIITDNLNAAYRITERGAVVEDTAAVIRKYHIYFHEKYGLENLATDEMIKLERQWDAEIAEFNAERDYADWCEVQDSMAFERMAGIW